MIMTYSWWLMTMRYLLQMSNHTVCQFLIFSVGQVNFKKQQAGLVDVEFRAWDLELSGLHNLQIENLHVVRHVGLRDIR